MDEHLGAPYLVFEYIDGQSLKEFLIQKGKLSVKSCTNILTPLLNAITYAHKKGIVHRDLNPSNILITSQNKPYLMDFGIAILLGQRADDGIWGTFKYISPEQCNNQDITSSSDLFSLGLILFEMTNGKAAITADNQFAIINHIVNEEIKYPEETDTALKEIMQKTLLKNPSERYADALDIRQDLDKHLNRIAPDTNIVLEK